MKKLPQHFIFLASIVIFIMGQVFVWKLPDNDRLVPYLLSAIVLALWAIYLQGNKQ